MGSRRFDFPDKKAQHASLPVNKEVFCDSLLGSAEPIMERHPGATHALLVSSTTRAFLCLQSELI
jgi:hypothetical protein